MDAYRLAMSDALVPAELEPPLIATNNKNLSELLSKRSVQLRSQKLYAAKPTLKQLTTRTIQENH